MKIFIKELFKKKTTKNYILIISCLLIILTISISYKEYSFNLINKNYEGSYIYTKLSDKDNVSNIDNSNIRSIEKCITDENNLYIYNDIKTVDTYRDVNKLSKDDFDKMNYNNEYIIYLDNWTLYNDMIDYLIDNGYKYDFYIYKENDLSFEKYYDFMFILIIIVTIICFIVFSLTLYNFIIDENKNNNLFKLVGYNNKKIRQVLLVKSVVVLVISIVINEIINIIINYKFELNNNLIRCIYIFLMLYTFIYECIYIKLKGGEYDE